MLRTGMNTDYISYLSIQPYKNNSGYDVYAVTYVDSDGLDMENGYVKSVKLNYSDITQTPVVSESIVQPDVKDFYTVTFNNGRIQ